MGFDKVKIKQICFLVLYVAAVILVLIYSELLFKGLGVGVKIFLPFLIGGAIAFILNIPMNAIENKLFKKWQGKTAKAKRPISMVLAMILVLAILALVVVAVVPQLRTTIQTLGEKIPPFLQKVIVWLEGLTTDYPELVAQIEKLENYEFDWATITSGIGGFLSSGVGSVISSTVNVASSIVGGIANVFIAIVFAIYILAQKEKLQNQGSRILDAYVKGKANPYIREVLHRLHVNFTNFICGQCLEAVILGLLFVIFMSIFQMPYAVMVGTLIAFTALIPIVGAFIGCGVGAFMIFIENPIQALWFVILFLIIQQLEGNLIYPRVVGNSVGLPSIWVLMSVSVGGSLFGVVGMLVFIPLMSTLYSLLRDDVNQRTRTKRYGKEKNNGRQKPIKEQKRVGESGLTKGTKQAKEQPAEKIGKGDGGAIAAKTDKPAKQSKAQKPQKQQKQSAVEVQEDFTSVQIIERLVAEQEIKVKQELEEQGLPEVKLHEETKGTTTNGQKKKNNYYRKKKYYNNKKPGEN